MNENIIYTPVNIEIIFENKYPKIEVIFEDERIEYNLEVEKIIESVASAYIIENIPDIIDGGIIN